MPEIETLLRQARPDLSPPPGVEEIILRSLTPAPAGMRDRLRHLSRSRRVRLLAVGLAFAGSGAALAATIAVRSEPGTRPVPPALSFGSAQQVGTAGAYLSSPPSVAVDDDGAATVAWVRAGRVVVSRRERSGGWSPAERLSGEKLRSSGAQVASGGGATVVIWRERTAGGGRAAFFRLPGGEPSGQLTVQTEIGWRVIARSRASDGSWSRAVPVMTRMTGATDGYAPEITSDGAGRFTVGYTTRDGAWTVRRDVQGRWSAPIRVSTPISATGLRLSGSPRRGRVVATWLSRVDDSVTGRRWTLWAAGRDGRGAWDAPEALVPASPGKPLARAAVDDHGDVVVGWTTTAPHAAVRERGDTWSDATTFSYRAGAAYATVAPLVGIDGMGRALVTMPDAAGTRIARGDASGGWDPPAVFRPGAFIADIAPDRAGGLLVTTFDSDGRGIVLSSLGGAGALRASASIPVSVGQLDVGTGADGTTTVVEAVASGPLTRLEAHTATGRTP